MRVREMSRLAHADVQSNGWVGKLLCDRLLSQENMNNNSNEGHQANMPEFIGFTGFRSRPILGGFCEGISRRDPSPVILVNGTYYVWYSRNTVAAHGYPATIWYATSPDGKEWTERHQALARGTQGDFDEHGVFTPSILQADGRYYLSYTAVPEPFYQGLGGQPHITKTAIGMAVAGSPDGPWKRCESNPVLTPGENPPEFDSLRVDDSCFVVRGKRYYMYYKGRQQGRTPAQTRMGLAIAESPEGPYHKHAANPVLDSGHEVCVWPHGPGIGALLSNAGPQGNSLQYSRDGIRFQKVADTEPPKAPGPYREDGFADGAGPGVSWGIAMQAHASWPYLIRFNCNLKAGS